MSGTAVRRGFRGPFNKAGSAGPMRFVVIGGIGLVVVGVIVTATLAGDDPLPESRVARQASVNQLPGGTNSTPYQARLAVAENQRQAEQAQTQGRSYTPPMNASQRTTDVAALLPPPAPPATVASGPPAPPPLQATQVRATTTVPPVLFETPAPPVRVQPAAAPAPQQNPIRTVSQTTTQQQPADDPAFREALNRMMGSWQGRPGRTTVTLPPPTSASAAEGEDGRRGAGGFPPLARQVSSGEVAPAAAAAPQSSRASPGPQGRVLVPAGRGIYAHTVLAVNSESGGPIVLQADTGPIAGARLIGTFTKPGTISRLVVRISTVQFQGMEIPAEGLVVAPDTMETAVASSVDQRLGERFLLPAAAAFVAGLGQAVATTSNTFGQVSPFGGQSYITRLNPEQQLAVGAGAAAQQAGRALEQSAPRGPLVHLAANAPVGVMFLSNLTAPN